MGSSGRLKHEQVRKHILEEITSGQLRPGDALPSEQQLADAFSIARATVRQAMAALESDRLITRVQGKGTFVHEGARQQLDKGLNKIESYREGLKLIPRRNSLQTQFIQYTAEGSDDIFNGALGGGCWNIVGSYSR